MELGTFGAVMAFAAEVVKQSQGFYQDSVPQFTDPRAKEFAVTLLRDGRKHLAWLEQARRENVTEMILEPIAGLERDRYQITVDGSELVDEAKRLTCFLLLEEREERFFRDASSKIPLPEVSKLFRKIAGKKESNLKWLRSLEWI